MQPQWESVHISCGLLLPGCTRFSAQCFDARRWVAGGNAWDGENDEDGEDVDEKSEVRATREIRFCVPGANHPSNVLGDEGGRRRGFLSVLARPT